MPLITIPLQARIGARVRVRIALSRPTVQNLRLARQPVPQPVVVDALIDTGAERSCIDPPVAVRASLPVHSFGLTAAPGTSLPPIPALGGSGLVVVYQASVSVLHPVRQPDLVIPDILVEALPLTAFGIEAVIGRDVLGSCVLVDNSPTGSATLAY